MSMWFPDHPGYPNGWYDEGPFGIWLHPSGASIVCIEPGYILTMPNKTKKEFDDLYLAMSEQLGE